jgi:hypothetical protein
LPIVPTIGWIGSPSCSLSRWVSRTAKVTSPPTKNGMAMMIVPMRCTKERGRFPKISCQETVLRFEQRPAATHFVAPCQPLFANLHVSPVGWSFGSSRSRREAGYFALAAIFLTMARTSLRSLSFRLTEYRRIWLRNRTSSSESCGRPLPPLVCPASEKN